MNGRTLNQVHSVGNSARVLSETSNKFVVKLSNYLFEQEHSHQDTDVVRYKQRYELLVCIVRLCKFNAILPSSRAE